MRYPASEKLEILHLVERTHLPIKQTLDKLGIPRTTFYRWYDHYQVSGPEALEDQSPRPSRVWNRLPDDVCQRIYLTMGPATSLVSWLNGWVTRRWDTSGVHHITRKHRARSSDGTRP
jgi:transposase-like protein